MNNSLNNSNNLEREKVDAPSPLIVDGNTLKEYTYEFRLVDQNTFLWSGSINASVFRDGKFVHINDLPMDEQIKFRLG